MSCRPRPCLAERNGPSASAYFFPAKKPDPKSRSISPSLAIGLYRKVPRGCSSAAWGGGPSCGVGGSAAADASASDRFGAVALVLLEGGAASLRPGLPALACRRTSLPKPLSLMSIHATSPL